MHRWLHNATYIKAHKFNHRSAPAMAAFCHEAAHRYVFRFAMAALAFGAIHLVPLVQLSWNFPQDKSLGIVDVITKNESDMTNERNRTEAKCCQGIRCNSNKEVQSGRVGLYYIFVILVARGDFETTIFEPMWDTVLRGLQGRENECGYRVLPMRAQHPDHNFMFPVAPQSGDVLILVGFADMFTFFKKCKNVYLPGGVSCIYYNSEPGRKKGAMNIRYDSVCEVWDYTRANEPIAPVVRHVPAGFLPQEATLEEMDRIVVEKVKNLDMKELKLVFIGTMTPQRKTCWEHMKVVGVKYFSGFEDVHFFGTLGLVKLGRKRNRVFLNIHNLCNLSSGPDALETVRLSQLLSAGSIVLSEIANPTDVKLYHGIVFFEPNLFSDTSQWSPELRNILTNRTALADWQLNSYKIFKKKFHPMQLMQDAGIWNSSSASSAPTPPALANCSVQGNSTDQHPRRRHHKRRRRHKPPAEKQNTKTHKPPSLFNLVFFNHFSEPYYSQLGRSISPTTQTNHHPSQFWNGLAPFSARI